MNGGYHTEERRMDQGLSGFVRFNYHQHEVNHAWWRGWIVGACVTAGLTIAGVLLISVANAQTVPQPAPSLPSSYTFTFSADEINAIYGALDQASKLQTIVLNNRSGAFAFDQVMQIIQTKVAQQNAVAAKVAEVKPAEKPKDEAPKVDPPKAEAKPK